MLIGGSTNGTIALQVSSFRYTRPCTCTAKLPILDAQSLTECEVEDTRQKQLRFRSRPSCNSCSELPESYTLSSSVFGGVDQDIAPIPTPRLQDARTRRASTLPKGLEGTVSTHFPQLYSTSLDYYGDSALQRLHGLSQNLPVSLGHVLYQLASSRFVQTSQICQ